MAKCDCCGNEYDRLMRIEQNGKVQHFDCFECAIEKMAPECTHCGTHVIGHGVEAESVIFCSAHCSRAEGRTGLQDRIPGRKAA